MVLYGRGTASVAEQLGCSVEEASDIKESVFQGFPAIKKFEEDSLNMAREVGYVTTVCGNKRRLPDLQLDEYEFRWKDGAKSQNTDVLDFDSDDIEVEVPDDLVNYYWNRLDKAYGNRAKNDIKAQALNKGIEIIDNGKKIADATRQCVNARIQGSASNLTKLAMIDLNNNQRLKELGFRILVPIHDEILAECPYTNLKECSELLADTMCGAAEKILEMPMKCDVECTLSWYGDSVEVPETDVTISNIRMSGDVIKEKETNTSHGMDEEKLRNIIDGNK